MPRSIMTSRRWTEFKGYSAQINATNMFDKTYVTLCQDIGCYYGLRRNVIATLRYKW